MAESSIGRAADRLNPNSINKQANQEALNQVSQQAEQLLGVMDQIQNETNALRGTQADFDMLLNSLGEVSNRIKGISNDINNLNNANITISTDVAVATITQLNTAINEVNQHMDVLSSTVGNPANFDGFKNAIQGISSVVNQFTRDLTVIETSAESTAQNISSAWDQAQQSIGQSSKQIQQDVGNIYNLNVGMENSGLGVFFKAIEKDFTDLQRLFKDNTNSLQTQFESLKTLGGQAASAAYAHIPQATDDLKAAIQDSLQKLQKAVVDFEFNDVQKNPSLVADKFANFTSEIMKGIGVSQEKLFQDLISNLPNNGFDELSNQYLKETMKVYEDFSKNYGQVIAMGNSILTDIKELKIEGADDAVAKIREQIAALQTVNNQTYLEMQNATTKRFTSDLGQVLDPSSDVAKGYNKEFINETLDSFSNFSGFRKHANQIQHSARNLEEQLDTKYANQPFAADGVNIQKIVKDTTEIDKLLKVFENYKGNVIENIKKAYASGDDSQISAAKNQLTEIINLTKEVNSRMMGIADSIDVSQGDVKNISEVRELVVSLTSGLKTSKNYYRELYDVAKTLNMDDAVKDIEQMNSELVKTQNHFTSLTSQAKSLGQQIKEGLGDFFSPVSAFSKGMAFMGISGMPIGFGGAKAYWDSSSDYYKKQAEWRMASAQAEISMGDINDPMVARDAADYRVYNQGMRFHEMTKGQIGFDQFNNSYINLMSNVGGQVGASDSQTIKDLNYINDTTFAGQKLYNISDTTMAEYTKTFYKDLRQSAEEVSYSFMKIAQTATSANIPVDQYMKTVTQLASQYRSLGLTSDSVTGIMDKFVSQGMSLQDAQSMTTAIGQATSRFADNPSIWLYSSAMTGQMGPDMFSSLRMAQDRWNPDGTVKAEFVETAGRNIDFMASQYGLLGNTEDAKWYFTNEFVKNDLGITGLAGAQLTNALMKDDYKTFETLLKEQEKTDKTVILEGQEDFENALKTLASELTEAHDIQALLQGGQYELARTTQDLRDDLFNDLKPVIENLIESITKLTEVAGGILQGIINSPVGQGVMDVAGSGPAGLLGTLTGLYVAKKAGGYGLKKAGGAIQSNLGKIFGRNADDVADLAKSGGKLSDAAGDVAKSGLLSKIGKSKNAKIAAGALALTGLVAVGSHFFGGEDEEGGLSSSTQKTLKDRINVGYSSGTSQLERDVTAIRGFVEQKVASDSWRGTATPVNPMGLYSSLPTDMSQIPEALKNGLMPMSVLSTLTTPGAGITNKITTDTNQSIIETGALLAADTLITRMIGKGTSKAGQELAETAVSKAASETAEKATAEAVEKVTKIWADGSIETISKKASGELIEKALGKAAGEAGEEALEKVGTKLLTKGLGSSALKVGGLFLGDALFNAYEPGKHLVQGDFMSQDADKFAANFGVDAGITAAGAGAGAAIGSAFFGVGAIPGAAVGALVAGLGSVVADLITSDKNGDGVITRMKDQLTGAFSGFSTDEIEVKRMIEKGQGNEYMVQQMQYLGFGKDAAQIMVDALDKHASKLEGLTNEQKLAWAVSFTDLKQQGLNDRQTLKELADAFKDPRMKELLTFNVTQSIAKNGGATVDEARDAINNRMENINEVKTVEEKMKDPMDSLSGWDRLRMSMDSNFKMQKEKEKWEYDQEKKKDEIFSTPGNFRIIQGKDGQPLMLTEEEFQKYTKMAKDQLSEASKIDWTKSPSDWIMSPEEKSKKQGKATVETYTETRYDFGNYDLTNPFGKPQKFTETYALPANLEALLKKDRAQQDEQEEKDFRKKQIEVQLEIVKTLQEVLTNNGLYQGATNGVWTTEFEKAVDKALDQYGFSSTGYGTLSAKMESGVNFGAVSKDGDNFSYGAYQIHGKHSMPGFLKYLEQNDSDIYNLFKGKEINSDEFKQTWKTTALSMNDEFSKLQQGYIQSSYYDPTVEKMKDQGFDVSGRSDALKNVIWQLAVNLGSGGVMEAFNSVKNPNQATDQQLIQGLYKDAVRQKPGNEAWYKNSLNAVLNGTGLDMGSEVAFDAPAGTSNINDINAEMQKSLFGLSAGEYSEQMKNVNTPFARGTLLHGIVSGDFGSSSYSTGDSRDRVNHLKMMEDLQKAGGSQESFVINSQAISRGWRASLDAQRRNAAGGTFYDDFTADVSPDQSGSIYRTDSIYKASRDSLSSATPSSEDKRQAIIAMNITNYTKPIDEKSLAEKFKRVLEEEGITASIEEIVGDIQALSTSLGKTIDNQNNNQRKAYD